MGGLHVGHPIHRPHFQGAQTNVRAGSPSVIPIGPAAPSIVLPPQDNDEEVSNGSLDADAWVDSLPPELTAHRHLLHRLLDTVRADALWRWLELSCSVARDAGDAESDLDVALGVTDGSWDWAVAQIPDMVREFGEILDVLTHRMAGWAIEHRRVFVQYASGLQLDLVVMPAGERPGLAPGALALYDPDGHLGVRWEPDAFRATSDDVAEWNFAGWLALGNLAKYLRRGSLWEALEQLHSGRACAWRLWAAAMDVDYPAFGVTSLLDSPQYTLPDGARATVPTAFDAAAIQHAALACADFLERAARAAGREPKSMPGAGMAAYTRQRLAAARTG